MLESLSEKQKYHYRLLDKVKVMGKNEPVDVIEILDGTDGENFQLKMDTRLDFGEAVKYYQTGKMEKANQVFQKILYINPRDKSIKIYLNRINHFLNHGIPNDWEGIENFEFK